MIEKARKEVTQAVRAYIAQGEMNSLVILTHIRRDVPHITDITLTEVRMAKHATLSK
mgnify:CR=1 FL=1